MELRHLRYFLAVAQELHFSRAAERLHISQPPLSRQIQDLERELGVELFRRNRRVELTEAGSLLVEQAQRAVEAADNFARAAELVVGGIAPALRVGYPVTAGGALVPDAIRCFESRFPDVDLTLVVGGSSTHLRAVEADLLDTAFVRATPDRGAGLSRMSLCNEPFVVAMHAGHPLAGHSAVAREQLRGTRLVLPSSDAEPEVHHQVTEVLRGLEPAPYVVLETSTLESAYSAVVARLGIAIISEYHAAVMRNDVVVCRPLVPPAPNADLLVVWNAERVGHPLGAFLDVVTDISSQEDGQERGAHQHDTRLGSSRVPHRTTRSEMIPPRA